MDEIDVINVHSSDEIFVRQNDVKHLPGLPVIPRGFFTNYATRFPMYSGDDPQIFKIYTGHAAPFDFRVVAYNGGFGVCSFSSSTPPMFCPSIRASPHTRIASGVVRISNTGVGYGGGSLPSLVSPWDLPDRVVVKNFTNSSRG